MTHLDSLTMMCSSSGSFFCLLRGGSEVVHDSDTKSMSSSGSAGVSGKLCNEAVSEYFEEVSISLLRVAKLDEDEEEPWPPTLLEVACRTVTWKISGQHCLELIHKLILNVPQLEVRFEGK